MTTDLSKLNFFSGANLMKRSSSDTGTSALTLPGAGLSVTLLVTHNLGYIPFFDAFADLDNDGIIWAGEKIDKYTETSGFGSDVAPKLDYWSTTTVLTIRLDNTTTPTATGTRDVWFVTYLDYGTS